MISLSLGHDIIDREDSFELNGLSKLTEFRIYISPRCFVDYGQFEVSNCPALISLSIVSFWNTIAPFVGSSFSVRGNKHREFLLVDCPSLSSIKVNKGAFNQSLVTVMESNNRIVNYEE